MGWIDLWANKTTTEELVDRGIKKLLVKINKTKINS